MKSTSLVLSILALVVFGDVAHAATKSSLGIKGGVNFADLHGVEFDNGTRTGFIGGAYGDFLFSEEFGLRVEGLYAMKGYTAGPSDFEITGKFDYIEFPVFFLAAFPAGETVVVDLFAGPTFGFNIKAEIEDQDGDTADVSDVTESFEFGAAVGAGLEFVRSSFSIVVDGRLALGATKLFDTDPDDDVYDAKNRGFAFMAGLEFPLGSK